MVLTSGDGRPSATAEARTRAAERLRRPFFSLGGHRSVILGPSRLLIFMTNTRKSAADKRLKKLMPQAGDDTPRYLQVARNLAGAIEAGAWKPNEVLPAERELCEQLNVSRVTLRQALDAVAEQGLISRRQGAGTFVTPHIQHLLSSLISFSETLRRKGYEPGTQWLEREVRTGTAEEVTRLGLSPNARVTVLTRLRSADGKVIAYERSVLPVEVVPKPDSVGDSLYKWLDDHDTPIVRALQYFRAANLSRRMADYLEMREGEAVLRVIRIGYGRDGTVIESSDTFCHGDFHDFVVELKR
jgi:GntR family transcriptional regulator, N-acetylglucosamine utilization regulator